MEPIKSDLKRICEILNKHEVEYMLIGGHAVAFHGYTRNTSDIDFWFNPTNENYNKLLNALEKFPLDVSDLRDEVFNPEKTFLSVPFHGMKVEFLANIPGNFTFREAVKASDKTDIDGVTLKVIGLEHLIENKSAVNRPIDKLDVEKLKKKRKPKS